ncbi:MAG: hypothetical protein HY735_18190 [Verrucomicrobia bacterium]|nr:hypothetical protein [Verrucomicrobiota bacterium]
MQTVLPSDFKRGMVLLVDGVPQVLEAFHSSGTAQTKHKLHVRLRHLRTGRFTERVFAENERVSVAELAYRKVQLSYQQGEDYVFVDTQSFDELVLTKDQIGDRHWFIKDDEEYKALFLEGKLLDIELPGVVSMRVAETGPAQKGGSDSAWKEAKLETGLQIMVPLFIATGEHVRVDTHERKYVGKETEERKG